LDVVYKKTTISADLRLSIRQGKLISVHEHLRQGWFPLRKVG